MTEAEIEALAAALAPKIARLLKRAEEMQFDADYHASLPVEERVRQSKVRVANARAAMREQAKEAKAQVKGK